MTPICAEELQLAVESDLSCYTGFLTSDMTPSFAAGVLQRQCLTKKFNSGEIPEEAVQVALTRLIESNEICRTWALKPESSLDDLIINGVKSVLDDFFHPEGLPLLNLFKISEGFGVGPGANVGASKDYSFLGKVFNGPMTCTDRSLYHLYRSAISHSPRWSAAEKLRYSSHGLRVVAGEKWSAVSKTTFPPVARGIGTQPLLNMLFQKGIGSAIESRLVEYFGIDLSIQPELNKRLALAGSKHSDGDVTIDLKEASNSIGLSNSALLIPRSSLDWLLRTRCKKTALPGGDLMDLYILSGMGNGYTFPLQTAIFASIAITCMRLAGIEPQRNRFNQVWRRWTLGNFGVFGDDIIVPKGAYSILSRALRLLGFRVNDDKSFYAGWFRESCGGDYFKGQNIRPVYCKSLATPQDVYSLFNRTVVWSAKHSIDLNAVWNLLRSRMNRQKLLFIPFTEGDPHGIKVPSFATPWGTASCLFTKSTLYASYRPKQLIVDLSRQTATKRKLGYHVDSNHHGSLVAFLGGFIRDGRMVLKPKGTIRYQIRWSSTPSWDWIPEVDLTRDQGERWKALAARIVFQTLLTPEG